MISRSDVFRHFDSNNDVIPSYYKNKYLRQVALVVAKKRAKDPSFKVDSSNYDEIVIKTLTIPELEKRVKAPKTNPKSYQSELNQIILRSLYPAVKKTPPRVKVIWLDAEEIED